MKELDIKKSLTQLLAIKSQPEVLASEFAFDFGKRRADLLCVSQEKTYGFEIKSNFDKLTNLSEQLNSYLKIFDYVYVVCDMRHLEKVRDIAPKKVGIYVCSEKGLTKKKRAIKNKNQEKIVILDAIPTPALRKYFKVTAKSKLELCNKISTQFTSNEIRKVFINFLNQKYSERTALFHKEASSTVTLDDIRSLFSSAAKKLE